MFNASKLKRNLRFFSEYFFFRHDGFCRSILRKVWSWCASKSWIIWLLTCWSFGLFKWTWYREQPSSRGILCYRCRIVWWQEENQCARVICQNRWGLIEIFKGPRRPSGLISYYCNQYTQSTLRLWVRTPLVWVQSTPILFD